jgi:anaerobic magnesium-protoporphyrin IX monomethyl ester cyclase
MPTQANKNRVLLISPSGWQKNSVNLGLASLAGPLVHDGFEVLIFDLDYRAQSDGELLERIREFSPFVIGVSIKTATATEGARIAKLAAQATPEAILVVGGPHVTLCAKEYLGSETVFHLGIMGEGEESFLALARALRDGLSTRLNKGVVWRDNDAVMVNEWASPLDLSVLPYPNFDVIFGFKWEGFRYPIVTSRGCPYKCVYCCVSKLAGSIKWRRVGAAEVVDELEAVVKAQGITHFEILDDNFTLHVDRAMDICRELFSRNLNLSWYCHNGIRADKITPELASLMKAAGCTSVAFGIETGNPDTFLSIKKGETLQHVVDAVNIVKAAGIRAVGYFIIGLPGDTLESFINTLRFQRSLNLDDWQFGIMIPYPRTEVWDLVKERGKFLCDIQETQHFGGDLVPISFELPEFPKEDMVRAYYISNHFELYEFAESLLNRAGYVTITYINADDYIYKVPGMIIACPETAKHRIMTKLPHARIMALNGFTQSNRAYEISVIKTIPSSSPSVSEIFVCSGAAPKKLVKSRAYIHLIAPLHNASDINLPLLSQIAHCIRPPIRTGLLIHYVLTAIRLSIPRPLRKVLKPTYLNLIGINVKLINRLRNTTGRMRNIIKKIYRVVTCFPSAVSFVSLKIKLLGMNRKT